MGNCMDACVVKVPAVTVWPRSVFVTRRFHLAGFKAKKSFQETAHSFHAKGFSSELHTWGAPRHAWD